MFTTKARRRKGYKSSQVASSQVSNSQAATHYSRLQSAGCRRQLHFPRSNALLAAHEWSTVPQTAIGTAHCPLPTVQLLVPWFRGSRNHPIALCSLCSLWPNPCLRRTRPPAPPPPHARRQHSNRCRPPHTLPDRRGAFFFWRKHRELVDW